MKKNTHTKQKGFTLLFSVLVTTLVVSISATIISIAIRQTILSSTSRESQYAFYAANTGLECAFFWDNYSADEVTGFVFPAKVNGAQEEPTSLAEGAITCIGQSLSIIPSSGSGDTITHSFEIEVRTDLAEASNIRRCANVTVEKTFDDSDGTVQTYIQSRGWNISCDDLRTGDNPRAVERGIELRYES